MSIDVAHAIELVARRLMDELCPFEGASGDFDACSNLTRQKYETMAAEVFGLTLEDYYALEEA